MVDQAPVGRLQKSPS